MGMNTEQIYTKQSQVQFRNSAVPVFYKGLNFSIIQKAAACYKYVLYLITQRPFSCLSIGIFKAADPSNDFLINACLLWVFGLLKDVRGAFFPPYPAVLEYYIS